MSNTDSDFLFNKRAQDDLFKNRIASFLDKFAPKTGPERTKFEAELFAILRQLHQDSLDIFTRNLLRYAVPPQPAIWPFCPKCLRPTPVADCISESCPELRGGGTVGSME